MADSRQETTIFHSATIESHPELSGDGSSNGRPDKLCGIQGNEDETLLSMDNSTPLQLRQNLISRAPSVRSVRPTAGQHAILQGNRWLNPGQSSLH
jgi:hypothetical protein